MFKSLQMKKITLFFLSVVLISSMFLETLVSSYSMTLTMPNKQLIEAFSQERQDLVNGDSEIDESNQEIMTKIAEYYSAIKGTVLDSMIDGAGFYVEYIAAWLGTVVVTAITNSFNPSLDAFIDLMDGNTLTFSGDNTIMKYDRDALKSNSNFMFLFSYAQTVGLVLASLILLFNLFFCIKGKANQIYATPVQLICNYMVAVSMIYLSMDITWELLTVACNLWKEFVMEFNHTPVSYAHFMSVVDNNNDRISLLGIQMNNSFHALNAIFPFLYVYLIWKLFKQFLRLYMEIVERYFVMVILVLFFPAAAATIISPGTSNIMKSYMRMFFSQIFIIVTNGVFMKVFITLLILGTWTNGILNYIAALAFMKVCQRLDSYMLAMGLNVAQTGGGLLDAIGNSGSFFGGALRSIGNTAHFATNVGKTIGSGLMKAGIQENNFAKYAQGKAIAEPMNNLLMSSDTLAKERIQSFNADMARSKINEGHKGTRYEINGQAGLDKMLADSKCPQPAVQELLGKGIKPEEIGYMEQTDAIGKSFSFHDLDGEQMAAIHDGKLEMSETYAQEKAEAQSLREKMNDPAYETDMKNASGSSEIVSHTPFNQDTQSYLTKDQILNNVPGVAGHKKIIPDANGANSKLLNKTETGMQKCLIDTGRKITTNGRDKNEVLEVTMTKTGTIKNLASKKSDNAAYVRNADGEEIQITWKPYKEPKAGPDNAHITEPAGSSFEGNTEPVERRSGNIGHSQKPMTDAEIREAASAIEQNEDII